jgi:hypothetical protein
LEQSSKISNIEEIHQFLSKCFSFQNQNTREEKEVKILLRNKNFFFGFLVHRKAFFIFFVQYQGVTAGIEPAALQYIPGALAYTVKKASRNSDVDNGGANQTTWGSENSYSHVVWFCATVVNIGNWRSPTWLFLQCTKLRPSPSEEDNNSSFK